MQRSTRQPKTISEQLNRQLSLYATAASATGVGLLAFAQAANAKVVYTPANVAIAPNSTYDLELNNDGIANFAIGQHSYPGYSATLYVGPGLNGVAARPGATSCNCESALALKLGSPVGPGNPFTHYADMAKVKKLESSIRSFGLWRDENNRYLALKFTINGQTHYGWARFNVQASYSTGVAATLTGYAYETVPNQSIRAGQTTGESDAAVNQGVSLGTLALGAAR